MSATSWLGQTLADRYEIRERIGQGGVAEVYKAYDRRLNREVAVKMIHPHLAKEEGFVARFEREARAVAQLRHPSILQVQDFHAEGRTFYMVMEYLAGPSLAGRLNDLAARGERMPLEETIRIMTAIGAAVDYAHSRGIIHRDVKPSNIMFGERGDPILTDFGLAKLLGGETFTPSGALIGTALYMSPEQVRGMGSDERSDIYSLGVVLFEMATGQLPFIANVAVNVMLKHLNDPPPSPKSINPDLPDALERAILTALEKDPDARFQSAGELVAALELVASRTPSPVVQLAPSPDQTTLGPPFAAPLDAGQKTTPRPRPEAPPRRSVTPTPTATVTDTPPGRLVLPPPAIAPPRKGALNLIWIAVPAMLVVAGIAAAL
ncbi:MAG: serine/threonine protein kinase, partial [Chloroflexi bacterium]|nr:serine/threonine protein kinase [Chloroflexota bacterium]